MPYLKVFSALPIFLAGLFYIWAPASAAVLNVACNSRSDVSGFSCPTATGYVCGVSPALSCPTWGSVPVCSGGQAFDCYSCACQCQSGYILCGSTCQAPASGSCSAGQTFDPCTGACSGTAYALVSPTPNTGSIAFTGGVAGASVTAGGVVVDKDLTNAGILSSSNSVLFGGSGSGEGIASNRTTAVNQYGLDFYTNGGTKRMSITNGGNVGIGTTGPDAKLQVYGDANSETYLRVRNVNAGSSAFSAFALGNDTAWNKLVVFTNSSARSADGGAGNTTIRTDSGKLLLGAGGATYHALDTNGYVGIGTTAPAQKLQVAGGGAYGLGVVCGNSQCLHFNNNGWIYTGDTGGAIYGGVGLATDKVWASSYAYLGAGFDLARQTIASLQNNTTLRGGLFTNSGDGLYNAAGTAAALGGWWHVINLHHTDNNGFNAQLAVPLSASPNDIFFRTSGGGAWTEWRKVLSENASGNVGIGTTSPERRLDVSQGTSTVVRVGSWANVSGDSGGVGVFGSNFYRDSGNGYKYVNTHASLGYAGMISSWGTLSFVTGAGATTKDEVFSPATRLSIDASGNVSVPGTLSVGGTPIVASGWQRSGTSVSLVNAGDNVGIGTAAPADKLFVVGDNSGVDVLNNDGNDRPGMTVKGSYPEVNLISTVADSNTNHGPTLRFVGYKDGNKNTWNHWVIGTGGTAANLDFGYSSTSQTNPHQGIAGWDGTNGLTFMRITSGGLVGIGTTNPLVKLQTVGYGNIGDGPFVLNDGSSSPSFYDAYVDGNSAYFHTPGLSVRRDGSGTVLDQAPAALTLYNNNGTNSTWTKLSLANREAAGSGNPVSIAGIAAQKTSGAANSWASGDLVLWTKNTGTQVEVLRATSTGRVGIGTTAPDAKVTINDQRSADGTTVFGMRITSENTYNGANGSASYGLLANGKDNNSTTTSYTNGIGVYGNGTSLNTTNGRAYGGWFNSYGPTWLSMGVQAIGNGGTYETRGVSGTAYGNTGRAYGVYGYASPGSATYAYGVYGTIGSQVAGATTYGTFGFVYGQEPASSTGNSYGMYAKNDVTYIGATGIPGKYGAYVATGGRWQADGSKGLGVENTVYTYDLTDGNSKYGIWISSTGLWTGGSGAANTNYGLYIKDVSGGDTNWALYSATGSESYFAGNVDTGADFEVNTNGRGVWLHDEVSGTRWQLHDHSDRLRTWNGSTELTYVAQGDSLSVGNLSIGGVVTCIQGTCPPNNAIRLTPNLHLNSGAGYAVIVNWDNGTTGAASTFRIGNGAGGGDVFSVDAEGRAYTNSWWRSYGASGWYSQTYGGGWFMQDYTWIRSYGDDQGAGHHPVYMRDGFDTYEPAGIGCGGGLGGGYTLHVCGSTYMDQPLIVNGSWGTSSSYYGYLNSGGAGHIGSYHYFTYSISSGDRVIAPEFDAYSDSRMKSIVGLSDPANDLAILKQLEVTDFKYIDGYRYGEGAKKGFIAQQVEKIIPEAVKMTSNVIPNVYAMSEKTEFDSAAKTLTVTMASVPDLAVGDTVQLVTDKAVEKEVIAVNGTTFSVKDWSNDVSEVFVYGKKVNDFRDLDYSRIFTLGVSAIQELSQQVEALKAENGALKLKLDGLGALERRLDDLEAKIK